MSQQLSAQTKRIRKYLGQGVPPKDIANKLKVSRQAVYNVQYQLRKGDRVGVAASGITAVKPTRKGSGTGITLLSTGNAPSTTTKPEPVQVKQTLWQRIKNYLFPNF